MSNIFKTQTDQVKGGKIINPFLTFIINNPHQKDAGHLLMALLDSTNKKLWRTHSASANLSKLLKDSFNRLSLEYRK
jgi:hypothetical protein